MFPNVVSGIQVSRVVDGDDHSKDDKAELKRNGLRTLSRRHLESYLFDEETLKALCNSVGRAADAPAVLGARATAISALASRNKPADDLKSAAPQICAQLKAILGLTGVGNDYLAFSRNVLVPLVSRGTPTYEDLKRDVLGA